MGLAFSYCRLRSQYVCSVIDGTLRNFIHSVFKLEKKRETKNLLHKLNRILLSLFFSIKKKKRLTVLIYKKLLLD